MSSETNVVLENSLAQAIKIITGAQINGQKVDQTILGVVRRHLQDNIYEVEYNGGVIKCYAEEGNTYLPQSSVYVLVPQGDFSQTKRIVGSASFGYGEKEKALTKVEAALNGYTILSDNLLKQNTNKWKDITRLGLNSYKTAQDEITNFQDIKTIYQAKWEQSDGTYVDSSYYNIDTGKAKIYAENAKGFMLKANFRTKLTNDLIRNNISGDYGLAVTLRFKSDDATYKNMEEKWDALKENMIYESYEGEVQKQNLQTKRTEIEQYFNSESYDSEENEYILDNVQTNLLKGHNEIEKFILGGKKNLIDSVLELSQSYSDFLKELSEYEYDEDGKELTIEKLKKVYDEWFEQELDITYQTIDISRGYLFGVDSMVGTPYRFNDTWYPQTFIQPVDFEHFAGFESIFFYCRGWESNSNKTEENILVKDVELYMVKEFDEEDSEYKLEITYPEGSIFSSFSTTEDIRVDARLIYQNEHNYTSRCSVEWFKEDPKVQDTTSEGYSSWAGTGWRRLINTQKNLTSSTCHFLASENQAYENNYMCVAKFGIETILKAKFILYNRASKRKIEIVSDSGTSYSSSIEEKNLTCLIDDKEYNFDDNYSDVCFNFNWVRDGNEKIVEDENKKIFITNNKLTFPSSEVLPNKPVEIKCLVEFAANRSYSETDGWQNEDWNPIGEATITLTDQVITSLKGYHIEIENGSQIFQYSESGVSPCSVNLEQPLTPKTLTCEFYSPQGEIVPSEKYKVKWVWPITNTMLSIDRGITDGDTYEQKECPISIVDVYNMSATNNQITCVIDFAGGTYYEKTNFFFGKVGENGTNATEVVARLVPILDSTDEHFHQEPLTLHVGKDNSGKIYYKWNNGELNKEVCLGLQLFRNNELIPPSEYKSIKWTIVGNNNLTDSFMKVEHSSIASDKYESCYITYDDTLENNGFDTYCHNFIIKAAAALEIKDAKGNTSQQMYYAYYPIPVIVHHFKDSKTPYSIGINKDKTLRQVMYNNEGRSPQYSKSQGAYLDFYNFKDPNDNDIRSIIWQTIGGIDYDYIEIPLNISPSAEGLYEENKDNNGNFLHPKYIKTKDTKVETISNGEYKKYYNYMTEYKIALTPEKIKINADIKPKYILINLDEDDLNEIDIFKKNGNDYNLIQDWEEEEKNFYQYVKITDSNLVNYINPYREGWYEDKNNKKVKTEKTKINNNTFYKLKDSYKEFSKTQNPKKLGWYIKKEDGTYELPGDNETIKDEIFYYVKKNDKYILTSPFRLKLYEIEKNDEDEDVYTLTIDETFAKNKKYYEKESFELISTYEDYVHPYIQNFYEQKGEDEQHNPIYVETSDINYDKTNEKYYIRTMNNNYYKCVWVNKAGEEVESQSPILNNWYYWDDGYKLDETNNITSGRVYYSLATDLEENIEELIKKIPSVRNWYVNDGKSYKTVSESKIELEKTYYQLFEEVEEEEVTSKYFSMIEGDNSPFLNIKNPKDEDISEDNLIRTRNLIESQLKAKRSESLGDKEDQVEKWVDLSADLLGLYEKAESSNTNVSINEIKQKYNLTWDKDVVSAEEILIKYFELQEKSLIDITETEEKIKNFNTEYVGNFIEVIPTDNYDGQVNNNLVVANVFRETDSGNKLEYTVYIPIYLYLNTYGLTALNHWDGNSVEINEDEKYVLAPQVGAGKKNVDDNTFTGVLMGTEKTYNQENGEEERIGILGYNHGKQSIWMDAETGNTILGLPEDDAVDAGNPLTEGRIELIPGGTSRIARWRFDSRSLYRVISKKQTKYLEGLDEEVYTEDNYGRHENYDQLSYPYKEAPNIKKWIPKTGDPDPNNEWADKEKAIRYNSNKELVPAAEQNETELATSFSKAPSKAHGSIPHDQQGILLSAIPSYISVKGKPFGEPDEDNISPEGIDYKNENTEVQPGDSLELQFDPNSNSVFTIFLHKNPESHFLTNADAKYVDEQGKVLEYYWDYGNPQLNRPKNRNRTSLIQNDNKQWMDPDKENAIVEKENIKMPVPLTNVWYREPRVGIDAQGRFYANSVRDKSVSMTVGALGAFGYSGIENYYTGVHFDVGQGQNQCSLIKIFTEQNPEDIKKSTMYFSSTHSDTSEGLRPIGFYSGEAFNIFTGQNFNKPEPNQNISTLQIHEKNMLFGISTASGTEKNTLDGSSINSYSEIDLLDIEDDVNPKEENWYELINKKYKISTDTKLNRSKTYYTKTETIDKTELFINHENTSHFYSPQPFDLYLGGDSSNTYKEDKTDKIEGNYTGSIGGTYTKTITGLIDYTGYAGTSITITNKKPNVEKKDGKYIATDTWSRLNLNLLDDKSPSSLIIDHRVREAEREKSSIKNTLYDKLILNELSSPNAIYTHYGSQGKIRILHRQNNDFNTSDNVGNSQFKKVNPGNNNPKNKKWYEINEKEEYTPTEDETVDSDKTYYEKQGISDLNTLQEANILLASYEGGGGITLWAENQQLQNNKFQSGAAYLSLKPVTNGRSLITLSALDSTEDVPENKNDWLIYSQPWENNNSKFNYNYWKISPGLLTHGIRVKNVNETSAISETFIIGENSGLSVSILAEEGIYTESNIRANESIHIVKDIYSDYLTSKSQYAKFPNDVSGGVGTNSLIKWARQHTHPFRKGVWVGVENTYGEGGGSGIDFVKVQDEDGKWYEKDGSDNEDAEIKVQVEAGVSGEVTVSCHNYTLLSATDTRAIYVVDDDSLTVDEYYPDPNGDIKCKSRQVTKLRYDRVPNYSLNNVYSKSENPITMSFTDKTNQGNKSVGAASVTNSIQAACDIPKSKTLTVQGNSLPSNKIETSSNSDPSLSV